MDEWAILMSGLMGGLYLVMHGALFLGGLIIVAGVFATTSLKKFKKISLGFNLKSSFYVNGYWPSPSKTYPPFYIERYAK